MYRRFAVAVLVVAVALVGTLTISSQVVAQEDQERIPAPPRGDQGDGPFTKMVIRGATLIDGTGAPPRGPVDIVVEEGRISAIRSAGTPGVPMEENRPPDDADFELDANGMYVMPGFVDLHVHAGGPPKNPEVEYAYKLWMAHGVTTVRGVSLADNDFSLQAKERSDSNEIVAPRIWNYQRPGSGWGQGSVDSPEEARSWVEWAATNGVDGMKLGSFQPDIMEALLDEAEVHDLGSTAHLGQTGVAQMNAIDAARLGLETVTHYYGHFESLLKDHVVQPWPVEMNYNDEQFRFGQVARLWDQIHPPGSDEWNAYLDEQLELGTYFDPTMTIYSAGRDVDKFRQAVWHDRYTLPSLYEFFRASRTDHGAYWYYWTTWDEVAWKNFYQVWFELLNDYKKMGGKVTTGSDSGFIYQTYGFGYVNELEMLQEAGFHPLEVIQAATMNGAMALHESLGTPIDFGIVRTGFKADMVVVPMNPLENLKTLYGTGAVKLNDETGRPERVGRVRWTIKDGIVYDAHQLLDDVEAMVDEQRAEITEAGSQ